MIIQCEQCQTKFRLDDSKIKENGVKVRCAKCRHVFTVKKQQQEEREESSFDTVLTQSPGFSEAVPPEPFGARREVVTPEFQPEQSAESPSAAAQEQPESGPSFDFGEFEPSREGKQPQQPPETEFSFSPEGARQETPPAVEETHPSPSREFEFGEVDFGPAAEQKPAAAATEELFLTAESIPPEQPSPQTGDEFAFPAMDLRQEPSATLQEAPPTPHGEIDFGDLDFGPATEQKPAADATKELFPTAESVPPEQPSPQTGDEFAFPAMDLRQEPSATLQETPPTPHGEIDFGDLDFGLTAEQKPAADATKEQLPAAESIPPEQPLPPLAFEFELPDSGAATQGQLETGKGAALPDGSEKPPLVDKFDFTMELPTPAQEQPKGEEPFAFEAPAEVVPPLPEPEIPVAQAPVQPAEAKPTEPTISEPPEPGTAAVGRITPEPAEEGVPPLSISSRRKPSSMLRVLVALLVLVIVGMAAFYGKDLYPMLKQKIALESGKIQLRSVTSSFIKNTTIGSEILVISGEAVNGFTTPRASLQVRGMVYGDKDQVLVSKNAYCGNSLSAEQLATMPLDAIELAMGNQVGSGLSNLEVAPGKALPFTVVIVTVPGGAKNIGVVPAGSQALGDKPK
jgi:predicted Zn finger-like uncharacterized protein